MCELIFDGDEGGWGTVFEMPGWFFLLWSCIYMPCKVNADSVFFSCELISGVRQVPGRTAHCEQLLSLLCPGFSWEKVNSSF